MFPSLYFNLLSAFILLFPFPFCSLAILLYPLQYLHLFFSLIFLFFLYIFCPRLQCKYCLSFNQSAAYSERIAPIYIWIVTPTVGLIVFITFDNPDTGASFSNAPLPPIRRQSLKRSQIASLFKGTDSQDGTGIGKVCLPGGLK
jgi:hypothetical protein